MASPLLRVCTGCKALTAKSPCPACTKARDIRRGSAASRGYGSRWRATSLRLRRTVLRWCGSTMPGVPPTGDSTCPQRGVLRVPSEVIDHIVPITGPRDPNLWNTRNFQGLCAKDHDRKRQRESMAWRMGAVKAK